MSVVTRDGLPIQMPSMTAVRSVSPKAAKALDAYNALQAGLPARPTDEQLNQLDVLRSEVFALLLDPAIQAGIESERRERAVKMHAVLAEVHRLLSEEEASWGLEAWRRNPGANPRKSHGALTVSVGTGGYRQTLTARQMLGSLQSLFPGRDGVEAAS